MSSRRLPPSLGALLAASLFAAAASARSDAPAAERDLKRQGADLDDADAGFIGILLSEACNCPECQSRRVPPAVAAEAEAQAAQQDSNGPAPAPGRYAKALDLLLQSQEDLCRPVPTSPTSAAQAHAWQAAASGIAGAIEALKAYHATT
ncbi:hypothetical protein [Pseudacidovorax intermedius]|uniref:hypothetical protein n=1 Tax=Pseudacidovorax intermedius TaxID=433924 RepID=UPI00034C6CC5|nr:hypothetical protein [Pseudacidovorax intermedius]